jgi:hypothetical protein
MHFVVANPPSNHCSVLTRTSFLAAVSAFDNELTFCRCHVSPLQLTWARPSIRGSETEERRSEPS